MPLGDLECQALHTCAYHVWQGTRYLVLAHYSGPAITLGFFVASALLRDVYLLFFGFGLTVDTLINGALKYALRDAVPQPTCGSNANWCTPRHGGGGGAECTYANAWELFWPFESVDTPDPALYGECVPCGLPNTEVQHAAFLATGILLYATQWHAPRLRGWQRGGLLLWVALVAYVHVYFGYADAPQVLLGSLAGSADAMLWQTLVYALAFPRFDGLLHWSVFTGIMGSYDNKLAAWWSAASTKKNSSQMSGGGGGGGESPPPPA